jgi:hypothetical protein
MPQGTQLVAILQRCGIVGVTLPLHALTARFLRYLVLLILNSIALPNRFFNFLALPSATMT